MQFVKHNEFEIGSGRIGELPLRRTKQHVLKHHVVGQQNVRRVVLNSLPHLRLLLTGISLHTDQVLRVPGLIGSEGKLLAVDQSVHRIDDDCPHSGLLRIVSKNVVVDRD